MELINSFRSRRECLPKVQSQSKTKFSLASLTSTGIVGFFFEYFRTFDYEATDAIVCLSTGVKKQAIEIRLKHKGALRTIKATLTAFEL